MNGLAMSLIRTDGGAQARVAIDEPTVVTYAEGVGSGVSFPAVVVFFDGTDYWLADGFHRYHAHSRAGATLIAADVRDGTRRDAVLHSLGSNATHGLLRSNADKRKAVETVLCDPEWSQWSDRKVADVCAVTHPFVASIRDPKVAERQRDARDRVAAKRVETISTQHRAGDAVEAICITTLDPAARITKLDSFPPAGPGEPPPNDDDGSVPSPEEIAAFERAEREERDALQMLLDSDDKAKVLYHENVRLRALSRGLQSRLDGMQNQSNELIRTIKSLQRKLERAEKSLAAV